MKSANAAMAGRPERRIIMKELIRTNDPVLISFIEATLNEAGIPSIVLDAHTSVIEGSIGAIQRRIMVEEERLASARRALAAAGLSNELGGAN